MPFLKRLVAAPPSMGTVFIAIAAIYLFTSPVEFSTTDGAVRELVADNLLHHGEIALLQVEEGAYYNNLWTIGPDGRPYAYFGIGQTLLLLPFLALLDLAKWVGLASRLANASTLPMAFLMAGSGALICALFFQMIRRLGYRSDTALRTARLVAFASILWVLSRQNYDMIQEALGITGTLYFLIAAHYDASGRTRGLILAGLCYGVALTVRPGAAAAAPALAWMLLGSDKWGGWRERLRGAIWFAIGVLGIAWIVPVYNVLRFGSPFTFGYQGHLPYMGGSLLEGILRWLISPWQGMFIYMPILLALPMVLRRFAAKHAHLLRVIALLFLGYLIFHAQFIGLGIFGWGPYYLLASILPLFIPFAEFFEGRESFPTWQRAIASVLIALSVIVQLTSISVPTERYQTASVLYGENVDGMSASTIYDLTWTPIRLQAEATVQNIVHLPNYERYLDTPPDSEPQTLMDELFAYNLPDWWWLFHLLKGGETGLLVPIAAGLSAAWLLTRRSHGAPKSAHIYDGTSTDTSSGDRAAANTTKERKVAFSGEDPMGSKDTLCLGARDR